MIVCGGGAVGGFKLGEKLADAQAKRLNLSPAAAKVQERKYEIGLALSLCNGGKLLASTIYSGLSKRDQEARQKEIDAAVVDADAGTRNYAVPDHPDMKGTITTSPEVAEGSNECRTVEDHLAEGDKGDSALVKVLPKAARHRMEHLDGGFVMWTLIQRVALGMTLCVAFGGGPSLHALRFAEKTTAKGSHILVARDCRNFSAEIKEFSDYDARHPCRDGNKNEGFEGPTEDYVGDEAELDFLLNLSEASRQSVQCFCRRCGVRWRQRHV